MNQKPRIFIGASTEGKDVLDALYLELNNDFELVRWDRSFFEPSKYTLECFEDKARLHDFAIFILHPDDQVISRGVKKSKTRDNVIFEYGLFFSVLGRNNVFLLEPELSDDKIYFPSDFYGITTIRYDYENGKPDMISAGIHIKNHINKQIEMQSYYSNRSLWPLKVSIISRDKTSIDKLQLALSKYDKQVLTTLVYENFNDVKEAMIKKQIDCAFIDIFSLDSTLGIDLIAYARDRHRDIGFALYGNSSDLYSLPGVEGGWRLTLEHFWKLQKDSNNESFQISVEDMIIMFFIYRLSGGCFGEEPGNIIKNIFKPDVIGMLKEWKDCIT
jgi:Predicted nucleotide-binding protein containing TIR -like domain